MSIKVALFDFDGTLVDSNEAVVSVLHLAAVYHRGYPFSKDELEVILGKPLVEQMAFLSETACDELVEYYRKEYRLIRDEKTKAYEGIREMLLALKEANIQIGIVSNKGRNGINHGMALLNLESLIDVSISKDDVIVSKPDPEGIFKALNTLGHPIDAIKEVVFVGDSGHDIETGKRAGTQTILVDWTLLNIETLKKLSPDFIAQSPQAIYEYILSH